MSDKYVLVDGMAVEEPDVLAWARWFETADRMVASTDIGEVHVSTVFLGLDHRFGGKGAPILWETMIFGGEHDSYQNRYTSRAEAEAGHLEAVALVGPKR